MVCPAGSVKVSDQPLIAAVPVLAMVRSAVSPVFHALTLLVTRQAPAGGSPGTEVDGTGVGSEVAGVVGVVPAGEVAGPNWLRKRQTSAVVHVVAVLVPPPSAGSGVWSPSNAAHWTGYPARHPAYAVVMCRPLPLAGSG